MIDVLVPSSPHIIQSKQSSNNLDTNNIQKEFKADSPCYALYFEPRIDQKDRWVPATVTKRLGSRNVIVRMSAKGPSLRQHLDQLRSRVISTEDTEFADNPNLYNLNSESNSSTSSLNQLNINLY